MPDLLSTTPNTALEHVIHLHGKPLETMPQDLYIPPDALRVFLEAFQGPLDLLLYLIKKQDLDIANLPIAKITHQYMEYVELMHNLNLELAAEYLVMAAMLAEIKSRFLLPRPTLEDEEEGGDPRADLMRRLQEYERFKIAAEDLDQLPRCDRDIYISDATPPLFEAPRKLPDVNLPDVIDALRDVMHRAKLYSDHQIEREVLSVRERMTCVLSQVQADQFTPIAALFTVEEGRMGVVVTLIAILELARQTMLEITQSQPFAPIYVKALAGASDEATVIDAHEADYFDGVS